MDKPQTNPSVQPGIQSIDAEKLADIGDIKIDLSMPKDERIRNFIRDIKNPYCFRHKNTIVRVSFCSDGASFQELLQDYFSSLSHCE